MNETLNTIRIFPGNWLQPMSPEELFEDISRPLEVDVGCGKGRFLLSRAERFPNVNFLGIDRMLRRIRKIDSKSLRRQLTNLRLLRLDAYYAVTYLMPLDAVSTYYIFFPDPWPKTRHHKNRLMNQPFLDALQRTLTDSGKVHFATDHLPYFYESMSLLSKDPRFREIETFIPAPEEQTDFERLFLDRKTIGRASFEKT